MSRIPQRLAKLLALFTLTAFTAAGQAQVTVVNMVPNSRSGETQQDSEPNLAVNPINLQQIAGTAFTPDPLNTNAPIYVSTNGGATWVLNSILPGNSAFSGTGDVTLRFGGTSNNLYAGDLRGGAGLRLNILRTANFAGPGLMTVLVDRNNVDQPYIQATTVAGGPDRVYVGNNDFGGAPRTATLDVSLDGLLATPPPPSNFVARRIETRGTSGQDGPPIRPIFHFDGTVYAAFYGWRAVNGNLRTADLVVVRDDNWAAGATQFAALVDPGDGLAGRRVVPGLTVPFNANLAEFGQERVGGHISLAVDPGNSSRVYLAWADYPGGNPPYTLHVRRSEDRGATWSADLITVATAVNPALAVNSDGQVGFLYQQVAGANPQRWETHLRRSSDLGVTWNDLLLAQPPANAPARVFFPYIGDYLHLMALGRDFYGIFSANNTPDLANFPQGVTYQRNANFNTHTLLNNDNVTPVAVSIDPFFFRVSAGCGPLRPTIVSFTQFGASNVSFLKCPAGLKVLSGGCSDDFTSTSLMSTRPWGDDGWTCDFKTQPGSLTSFALCESLGQTSCRGVTTVQNTIGAGTSVSVACPFPRQVIGGGCSDDFTSTNLRTSMPSGNGWSCQFVTNPGSLTAYALCANATPGATIQTVSLTQTTSNVAFIKCPVGKRVLGGGCQDVLGSTLLESTYPWANDGWICNFQRVTGNLNVFAICE